MGEGFGFGKIILFGEHFVVYGQPALVMALSLKTQATLVPFIGNYIIDNRPKHPHFVPFKYELYERMAAVIADAYGMTKQYSFVLGGNLPVTSGGVGASAAAAVAITRALAVATGTFPDNALVMRIALEGERMIHGRPSGIDTTAATLGGVLEFVRTEEAVVCKKIVDVDFDLPLLVVDCKKTADTQAAIAHVAQLRKANPGLWSHSLNIYQNIFHESLDLLKTKNLEQLGRLFDKQQNLLRDLGLSCREVESVCAAAQTQAALGCKMTGSCQGGLVLILARDKHHVKLMAQYFRNLQYFCLVV